MNSKNKKWLMQPKMCAMLAMKSGKPLKMCERSGPGIKETGNSARRIAAFTTIGPSVIKARRKSEFDGSPALAVKNDGRFQPAQEVAVINKEFGELELVWIEKEWRQEQCNHSTPEVQEGDVPHNQGTVEKHKEHGGSKIKTLETEPAQNEDVIQVETRMRIVERQESVQRKLRSKIEVLTRKHLLSHSCSNLGCEVQDRTKSKVSTFSALEVFTMLDSSSTQQSIHTSIDILVQMQSFLRFRDTSSCGHEDRVQKIRMPVMQLSSNICQGFLGDGSRSLTSSTGSRYGSAGGASSSNSARILLILIHSSR
ncbi:hypothetical protein OGAPHI_003650 [Ogataea philodendri]|uniref:Uncharacterized protein n=1 Tax=Ogataea philodendri TaxID=1378263 RepID=A0A9P8T520_9ASCO|nr:uncharacterized protein OGAPHI_003650 [Ogataea philodendri]KAH3665466.1 hypothetical protein OGAPHI_003650 [Ogataea philodendri]